MRRVAEGFTLIELSLALAFIAVLSIIMVLIITNSISAYHRGLTLNSINTVGMDLTDNMREAVQNSSGQAVVDECAIVYGEDNSEGGTANRALEACQKDKGAKFVSIERYGAVKQLSNGQDLNVPVYGAFCTGNYSYIWNSGYFFNTAGEYSTSGLVKPATFTYKDKDGSPKVEGFKLIRLEDTHRAVCKAAAGALSGLYNEAMTSPNIDIGGCSTPEICDMLGEAPVELLGEGENNLALYDLTVTTAADAGNTNNMFYAVSFILGTLQGGMNVTASGDYCAPPEDDANRTVGSFDYCAINKFNFAAQATGD